MIPHPPAVAAVAAGGGGTPTPTLKSATGSGGNYDLVWTNGGVDPAGGFDIIIDGTDTNQANRTIWLETTVGPLDESRTHCFQVQARYTDAGTFPNSNELCVSPSSGGGGGGVVAAARTGRPPSADSLRAQSSSARTIVLHPQ